jgi:hypothetical protein
MKVEVIEAMLARERDSLQSSVIRMSELTRMRAIAEANEPGLPEKYLGLQIEIDNSLHPGKFEIVGMSRSVSQGPETPSGVNEGKK